MMGRIGNKGFSLTEVMLAAGILAVGFMLVAATFPVGIKLTATATERTIAAVAADEAFAKVQLYGVNIAKLPSSGLMLYHDGIGLLANTLLPDIAYSQLRDRFIAEGVDPAFMLEAFVDYFDDQSQYPSTDTGSQEKRYFWSALCGDPNFISNQAQVTVFVSRKTGAGAKFPADAFGATIDIPRPVEIDVQDVSVNSFVITDPDPGTPENEAAGFILEGAAIVDGQTGDIMLVLERIGDTVILSENTFDMTIAGPRTVWVVPPAIRSSRDPCVVVYQKVVSF